MIMIMNIIEHTTKHDTNTNTCNLHDRNEHNNSNNHHELFANHTPGGRLRDPRHERPLDAPHADGGRRETER